MSVFQPPSFPQPAESAGPAEPAAPAAVSGAGSTPTGPADAARRIDAHGVPGRVPWIAVGVFTVIAVVLAWIAILPLWLSGTGLEGADPVQFQLLAAAMMYTPTVAALVAVFLVQRPTHPARQLGLVLRPVGRTLLFVLLGIVAPVVLILLGTLVAGLLGTLPIDPAWQSLLRETVASQLLAAGVDPAQAAEIPNLVLTLSVLAQTLLISVPLASLTAFGEELGWRGFLLTALRPLGTWPAVLLSSVVWGLWHAPLILLGYNFNDRTIVGVLWMTAFCIAVGLFLSWLRLRSESVFPAAFAHGALNASALLGIQLFGAAQASEAFDSLLRLWPAWLLYVIGGVLLLVFWGRRPKPQPHRLARGGSDAVA